MVKSARATVSVQSILSASNFYEVLGLQQSGKKLNVGSAYKRACLAVHPDKCDEEGAEDAFSMLHDAYETLSDKTKKDAYDDHLAHPERNVVRDGPYQRAARFMSENSRTRPMSDEATLRREAEKRRERYAANLDTIRAAEKRRDEARQAHLAEERERVSERAPHHPTAPALLNTADHATRSMHVRSSPRLAGPGPAGESQSCGTSARRSSTLSARLGSSARCSAPRKRRCEGQRRWPF